MSSQGNTSDKGKGTRISFKIKDDIDVLKFVVAKKPFHFEDQWENVYNKVHKLHPEKPFTVRNIKDRVIWLIKKFRQGERLVLKSSGNEEEVKERERLLEEVAHQHQELKNNITLVQKNSHKSRAAEGKKQRDVAAGALSTQKQAKEESDEESDEVHDNVGERIINELVEEQMLEEGAFGIICDSVSCNAKLHKKKKKKLNDLTILEFSHLPKIPPQITGNKIPQML